MRSLLCVVITLFTITPSLAARDENLVRLFFLPAGVGPESTTTGQPFEYVTDGGTNITIEVFFFIPDLVAETACIGYPCDIFSVQSEVPALHLVPNSANINTLHPYNWAPGILGFPAIHQGNCEIMKCDSDVDCFGSSMCQASGVCPMSNPRTGVVSFVGPIGTPTPSYVGEVQYRIPNHAAGRYMFAPVCCPSDENCDNRADAGCPLVFTSIDSGAIPFDIIDPLIITIRTGSCQLENSCTDNTTRFQCEESLGGIFTPDASCPSAVPISSDWPPIVLALVILTTTLPILAKSDKNTAHSEHAGDHKKILS